MEETTERNLLPERDPLKRFPYEIWVEFIQNAISREPTGPLPFIEVSLSWMENLIKTPDLWSRVYINGDHDQAARVETFLSLSDPSHIDLIVDADHDEKKVEANWGNVLQVLQNVTQRAPSRIRRFVFGRGTTEDAISTIFKEAISQYGPDAFHSVKNIQIEVSAAGEWGSVIREMLAACATLQSLEGDFLPIQDVTLFQKPMKRAIIYCPPNESWPLGNYDNHCLQELFIFLDWEKALGPETEPEQSISFCFPPLPLQWLYIEGGSRLMEALKSLIIPPHTTLQELKIKIPWYEVASVLPHLSSCPCLRRLSLDLETADRAPSVWKTQFAEETDLCHIQELSITLLPHHDDEAPAANVEEIIRTITGHYPLKSVKHMKLRVGNVDLPASLTVDFYRSFGNLQRLDTDMLMTVDDHASTALMSDLIDLKVLDWKILRDIEAPRLIHLEVNWAFIKEDDPSVSLPISLESLRMSGCLFRSQSYKVASQQPLAPWSLLRKLEWSPSNLESVPELRHLPALEEILFAYRPLEWEFPFSIKEEEEVLNIFLQVLMRHHNACPRLRIIKSGFYPQWSLLFAFINQRHRIRGVVPIETIALSAFPQMAILKALVWCLNKEASTRPKSTQNVATFDATIQARLNSNYLTEICTNCIKAGYVACQPVKAEALPEPEAHKVYDSFNGATEQSALPIITSPSEAEIYNRNYFAERPIKSTKTSTCFRHFHGESSIITACTLSGLTFDNF